MSAASGKRIAAIDVGTNSVLMLIAERAGEALSVLIDRAQVTRLGKGVDRTRRLDAQAIERTLHALGGYATEARALGASIRAVGTSALRDAENAADFEARALALLGTPLETIAGEREAELTFAGALEGLDVARDQVSVVDVGGGSTEVIALQAGKLRTVSVDVGAVRLSERFALQAPTSTAACDRVRAHAEAVLRASSPPLRSALVAVAGTATTLAAVKGAVEPFDEARIHGQRIGVEELSALTLRLAALDLPARAAVPGLGAPRADVIVAGSLVLEAACAIAGASAFTVSCTGLRYGLALEALNCGGFANDPIGRH